MACHHPFTAPKDGDLEKMVSEPAATKARAYDMVLNGNEVGGGSIRIHTPEDQYRMLRPSDSATSPPEPSSAISFRRWNTALRPTAALPSAWIVWPCC